MAAEGILPYEELLPERYESHSDKQLHDVMNNKHDVIGKDIDC